MMYGVRKSSRFVFVRVVLSLRNSHPRMGRDPRNGTFEMPFTVRSWMSPPSTTVSWSFTTTVVFAERLLVVGPS